MRTIRFGLLLVSLGSAACALAQSTVTLEAFQKGKSVGTLVYSRNLTAAGQRSMTKIDVTQDNKAIKVVLTSDFDKKGASITRVGRITQGGEVVDFKATFSGSTAHVTVTSKGNTRSQNVVSPSKASSADPTLWWFMGGAKPRVGVRAKYQIFNLVQRTWQDMEATYIGDQKIKVGNKTVNSHVISEKRSTGVSKLYLDDKGMPLVIEQPTVRFVRR